MRRILTLAAALAVAVFTALPVQAQVPFSGYKVIAGAGAGVSVVSTDVALYVKYVGTTSGKPTVEVAAGGDITLKIAGSVDATAGCPAAGTGIIDVSDAACDTVVEVINSINTTGSNWRVAPGAKLGSDSSNDTFATLAATDTNIRTTGAAIYNDSGVTFDVAVVVGPPNFSGAFFFQGSGLNANPFASTLSVLSAFRAVSTYGSGTSTINVYAVAGVFDSSRRYTETVRTIWTEAGGATTAENQTDFTTFPLMGGEGEKIIVRLDNSAAMTSPALVAAGAMLKRLP